MYNVLNVIEHFFKIFFSYFMKIICKIHEEMSEKVSSVNQIRMRICILKLQYYISYSKLLVYIIMYTFTLLFYFTINTNKIESRNKQMK